MLHYAALWVFFLLYHRALHYVVLLYDMLCCSRLHYIMLPYLMSHFAHLNMVLCFLTYITLNIFWCQVFNGLPVVSLFCPAACEKEVQKVCANSLDEHLQPFKDKMDTFLTTGK